MMTATEQDQISEIAAEAAGLSAVLSILSSVRSVEGDMANSLALCSRLAASLDNRLTYIIR